jgi:hypothetical protein
MPSVAAGALPRAFDGIAVRTLTWASAVFAALTAIHYVCTISWVQPFPRDATTLVVGRDFLNFWMYGRAAWMDEPSRFYDLHAYHGALAELLGPGYPGQNWSYPPSVLLLAAPFGRLPYFAALLCWTLAGLGLFLWAVSHRVSERRLLLPIMLSPAAVICLLSGQSSFLTAAMLLTIFACLDRRPLLAGILIGVLTLKPQLGVLFPVMLAASGRWRVFTAAAATAVLIAAATTVLFGPQAWIDFVTKGVPIQNLVLADPARLATSFYPTVFMNLRGIDASYAVAMAVQACFTSLAIGAVFIAFRAYHNADPDFLMTVFMACSIAAVPYLLVYDTLTLCALAAMLLASGKLDSRGQVLAKLTYWLPLLQVILGSFHVPGPAFIPPLFAGYLLLRLRAQRNALAAPREGLQAA